MWDSQLEVIFLSMDNLWRSTQSLYVTLPLHFYSFTKATEVGVFECHFFLSKVAWIIDWPSQLKRMATSIEKVKGPSTDLTFAKRLWLRYPKESQNWDDISYFNYFNHAFWGQWGSHSLCKSNLLKTWWQGLLALPFLWCRCDLWAPLRIELLSRDEVLCFVRGWTCYPRNKTFIGFL